MKVRFFLKTPPGGDEPVDYVEIDADDSGRNVIARAATDGDKERFPEEYQRFEEARDKGEVQPDEQPVRVPPSVAAAANLGQDRTQETFGPGGAGGTGPLSTPASDERAALGDKAVLLEGAKVNITTQDAVTKAPTVQPEPSKPGEPTYELEELTVADAVPRVNATDDVSTLERWAREEESSKNRQTLIDAIDHRIDVLSAQQPEKPEKPRE